jgi:hypothetical protein
MRTPTSLECERVGVRRFGAALAVLIAGCAEDKADQCDLGGDGLGTRVAALEAVDRKIVGLAAPYHPDLGLAARDAELAGSIAARREVAWQIVGKVLAPVPLGEPRLAEQFGGAPVIPTWHTWYARDDFERVFKRLYVALGPDGRTARAPFGDAAITDALDWNTRAVDEQPAWPEQRYLDYLAAIDNADEQNGVGGISRVGYSPGALRHLIAGYAKTYACRESGEEPPAFAPEPVRAGQDVVANQTLALEGCQWRTLGPYVVADGERFELTLAGTGDADLYVRRGAAPDAGTYDCRSAGGGATERCVIEGGGMIYAAVLGFGDAAEVTATARYREADVRDPTCLDGELPRDAVVIKADWRRIDFDATLPVYDTSGGRMAVRLRPDGTADWGPGDGIEDPAADSIYTLTLPNAANYRLAGLHIMTKELTHWVWITLWWSNDPDTDFGADRPAAIAALPGPWRNYKMCVATGYLEGDPDPRGGFTGSLGDALASVSHGPGTPTWCSNPYLEIGAGNADTNCIGCHQHGGTSITPEAIISEEALFPHHGRTRVRNNFFTDYSWAVQGGRGDDLAAVIQSEIEYWDASDP